MITLRKRINKENLTYYVQQIVEDENCKKEFIKNCTYLQFYLKVADLDSDNNSLSIVLVKGISSIEWEIKKVLEEFIPTLDAVEDFVNNCEFMHCSITRANANIRITYMDNGI